MPNNRKKVSDKVVLIVGIVFFIVLMNGSLREYRSYRRGIEEINKTKENIAQLQGRKERLEKLLEETKKPEFIERQLREKLGLVEEGEEYLIVPTVEPKLEDLRLPEPTPRKVYWREWLKLLL